ncbi:MAG: MATE family efflux transporter, partial [Mycobacterium sp.]
MPTATGRRIAALAFPALGVLAAEPLYLLFDLAIIGRLGAVDLAGLAIGALVMGVLSSQLTFLSYGTTARAARFYGVGDRAAAAGEGVQATWLALGIGTTIVVAVQLGAAPLVALLAGGGRIADAALPWVRIA